MNLGQLRESARLIWEAALHAASPSVCVRNAIQPDNGSFSIRGRKLSSRGRLIVIGAGKASAKMAQVVEEIFGDRIAGGLVVTKYGHSLPLTRIQVVEAAHPIPDDAGVQAVVQTREAISGLTSDDTVLGLISGGGSALWPAPAEGISLEEKQKVTSLLMREGATIRELNAVRKHLSSLKGGQLARWASPARVVSLIMSDVIGDPLDFIASGPTAPDTTSFADAMTIVKHYGIEMPASVQKRFEAGVRGSVPETPKPGDPVFTNVDNYIIANNQLLIDAAVAKARNLGFNALVLASEVEGEAKEVARIFTAIAAEVERSGNPVRSPACVLAAGETTVTVRGQGLGGRNQEMALAWALSMAAKPQSTACCFASVASDGTDGPTDAAGGLVDAGTAARAVELGLAPLEYLRSNDSWHLLKATGDLIITGPTQTNLMDLQILLVG